MKGIVAYQAAAGVSGSVAEWSKALVLGTSLSGGVGSNPTAAKVFVFFFRVSPFGRFFWYKTICLYLSLVRYKLGLLWVYAALLFCELSLHIKCTYRVFWVWINFMQMRDSVKMVEKCTIVVFYSWHSITRYYQERWSIQYLNWQWQWLVKYECGLSLVVDTILWLDPAVQ